MSGHSKWSTIKRKKETTDQARGKLFSKLSRAITIAAKSGSGTDPDSNSKLRMAIDAAKTANMPKANIERALSKGESADNLEEITYEGFGPGKINVVVQVATDNRNRTGQEVKGIFDKSGGQLAGPGSVSYNFDLRGLVTIKKVSNSEDQMLKLIDLGIEDLDESEEFIEAYVESKNLSQTKDELLKNNIKVESAVLVMKPKTYEAIDKKEVAEKVFKFLETLEDHDDIQKVFTNVDINDDIVSELS